MTAVESQHAFVSPETPIDITNCDREPIHIPGAIQPHGAMLVLRARDLVVRQASANAGDVLGTTVERILDRSLGALIGERQSALVREALARGEGHAYEPIAIEVHSGNSSVESPRQLDAVVHAADGLAILELEPRTSRGGLSVADFQGVVRTTLRHVERATTIGALAQAIADQMRALTGFDRVWVYRFHEDWHGEIIGESKIDEIETWLGMHYPASDIPAQARALFLRHWLRMIPDVGFTPVPLVPVDNPDTGQPTDMSDAMLRSVSPIHVQYLRNMGVRASLVISLINRGKLWGLISGHHYSGPRIVPYATRVLCEFLAQALSLQVGMAEQVEDRDYALHVRDVAVQLRDLLSRDDVVGRALTSHEPTLLDLANASGGAIVRDGELFTVGAVPEREQIEALAAWLRAQSRDVWATASLPNVYPPAATFRAVASGLLAASLSPTKSEYLLWFRGERKQTVRWAGNPRKPVELGPDGIARLSPRGSFELWEEEMRGTSAPWSKTEIDAASDLRRTVLDLFLRRAEELAELNTELATANYQLEESAVELETQAEELLRQREERESLLVREREARLEAERANRAKADFLAMMSHELRTPLNAIGGYAQIMEMGVHGGVTEEQHDDLSRIQQSQRHLLGLINSILNFAKLEAGQVQIALADVGVGEVLEEIDTLARPLVQAKGLGLDLEACDTKLSVRADQEKLRQILLNLITNAVKFTDAGGRITVRCQPNERDICIAVEDTGRGIPAARLEHVFEPFVQVDRHLTRGTEQGVGLGLAISRDLARAMGGDLEASSVERRGSTFTVRLPRPSR